MKRVDRRGKSLIALGGFGFGLVAVLTMSLAPPPVVSAAWPWHGKRQRPSACGHAGCAAGRCLAPAGWAGQWYWVRSPDQERRVVMSLYNRYCIRCHAIDGRGVWDIPDVPDFTDPRWQASRPDVQIVNILMEGRGAVMPMFRGTLTLEESCAMARYLRTFVPGTEVARPELGRAADLAPVTEATADLPPLPAAGRPLAAPRSSTHR